MLIRYILLQNSTSELNIVYAYQNASSLTNTTRAISYPTPELASLAPNGTFSGIDTPAKLFNLSAALAPYNQPENYTDRYHVTS